MEELSHAFPVNLWMSLHLQWVSHRQHRVGSCFHFHKLCVLISCFRQFTFKLLIDLVGLLSTMFVTVLFIAFVPFSAFSGFNQTFHMIPFYIF